MDEVIGIYMEIPDRSLQDIPEDGLINYFFRLLQVPIIQSTRYKVDLYKDKCLLIPIQTTDLKNWTNFEIKSKSRLDMFSNGYSKVKEYLEPNECT
jgi:hypothetical protein